MYLSTDLFLQNKYHRWYCSIITRASNRMLSVGMYVERHHVIPKSLGGDNTRENLVSLTAREHFICHWLLTKMTNGRSKSKMWLALLKMCVVSGTHQRYLPSASTYENIRLAVGKANRGENNPSYGKRVPAEQIARARNTRQQNDLSRLPYKHSEESKRKIGEANRGRSRPDMVEKMKLNNQKINHNTNTGKHWYNDGVRSYLKTTCPEGCVPGRL
jgi:5-methylcytosine-specific restriction endonuclease McrA